MTDPITTAAPQRRAPGVRDVTVHDSFWAPRHRLLREQTIHDQYEKLESSGRLGTMRLTWTPGSAETTPHPFYESDLAKWLEAASYVLAAHEDERLRERVDATIELLAGAQQEDGYLNAYFTVVEPGRRFTDLRDAHELYGAGHLIEAAVAHYQATGQTTLLDVVRRYADLIVTQFGPGGPLDGGYCGHEEIELALVRLSEVTGDRSYLDLAAHFVNVRGTEPLYFVREQQARGDVPGYFGSVLRERPGQPEYIEQLEYWQTHLPVREQTEAVGHAVRAMYLYCAMTDVASRLEDDTLLQACTRLWQHLTTRRMYITGGIGDAAANEGFTRDFSLPDHSAYAETCAAIGLVMWARRMANVTGEAGYLEVLERALYNGAIVGMSEDGTRYFYDNPLASDGRAHRKDWFDCACCPPNLARLEGSVGTYAWSVGAEEISLDLYLGSELRTTLAAGDVALRLDTEGPAGAAATVRILQGNGAPFTVRLRVPQWAESMTVRLNGAEAGADTAADGYRHITRVWAAGDTLELTFTVRTQIWHADPRVASAAGRVALQHGPFVYCVEGQDIADDGAALPEPLSAQALRIEQAPEELEPREDGALLRGTGWLDVAGDDLYSHHPGHRVPVRYTAIPYYRWNNRGQDSMAVWVRHGRPSLPAV